jgi:hypothetical protein
MRRPLPSSIGVRLPGERRPSGLHHEFGLISFSFVGASEPCPPDRPKTGSCAGVCWSAPELGTIWAQRMSSSCPAHLTEAAYRPTKHPSLFVNRRVRSVR